MSTEIKVRRTVLGDIAEIEALYPSAFSDEDLLPLVHALLDEGEAVLSLTAVIGSDLAGHALFSRSEITDCAAKAALLGPLAVEPASQKSGVGTAMIREGLEQLKQDGAEHVFVLGDPAYYARFGFTPEKAVAPPYRLPDEWRDAWQSVGLGGPNLTCGGMLVVPRPWRQAALWAP
jgi:putative acetyltransferase